jgi:hypothetical protein
VLAAQRTTQAAEADVRRRETFDKAVRVLVDNQLRAGAEASRADAELARARVNLARAQQQEKISRAALVDILSLPDTSVEVQESSLPVAPPDRSPETSPITSNPVAEVQHARVEEAQARVHILDRSYYPKFYFQSSVYGRGSGWNPAGNFEGGTTGLGPDRSNWAAGLTVTFPVFDIFAIRSRKAVESANERAEAARYDQDLQDLTGQLRKAQASLEGARQVAQNTPVELDAARTTETQERSRYQAGLATLVEVADAQSLLVQAETDDALARLAVWQNLAAVAAADDRDQRRSAEAACLRAGARQCGASVDDRQQHPAGRECRYRISHDVEQNTRTMPVELDVHSMDGRLSPGSYSSVKWPVHRAAPTMFVPVSAVTNDQQRTFVERIGNGKAEWVDVVTGLSVGANIEVFGDLKPGDEIIRNAADAIRPGQQVKAASAHS